MLTIGGHIEQGMILCKRVFHGTQSSKGVQAGIQARSGPEGGNATDCESSANQLFFGTARPEAAIRLILRKQTVSTPGD